MTLTDNEDTVKESLLAAATDIIARAGFQALRMRDVARRAGVALGTPSYKFKNREGLLLAALERANEMQNRAQLDEYQAGLDKPPYDAALGFTWARVRFAFEHPGETLLRAHAVYSNAAEGFRSLIGRYADENMERINHIVQRLEDAELIALPEAHHRHFFVRNYTYLGFSYAQSTALSLLDQDDIGPLKLHVACSFEALLRGASHPAPLVADVQEKCADFLESDG